MIETAKRNEVGRRRARPVRCGMQSIEVLLTLPLVVLTFVSGIHYGVAGVTKQTLQSAAVAAANEAALGGSETDVRLAADNVLAAHEMEIGSGLFLLIEDQSGNRFTMGDKFVVPTDRRDSRLLLPGEVRAKLYVARSATAIPDPIQLKETSFGNYDLSAVATSMSH